MKFAQLYNWNEGVHMHCDAPLKAGDIVRVVGMHGGYQKAAPADPGNIRGRLYVSKHDSPGPQVSVFLPWMVLKGVEGRPVDTSAFSVDDIVYLHESGKWDTAPPEQGVVYPIGHVLEIGPLYGAVRLEPGAYGHVSPPQEVSGLTKAQVHGMIGAAVAKFKAKAAAEN